MTIFKNLSDNDLQRKLREVVDRSTRAETTDDALHDYYILRELRDEFARRGLRMTK